MLWLFEVNSPLRIYEHQSKKGKMPMTTLNLQRFTRVETLRAIKQELLAEFLLPYNDFFQSRGVSLAPQEDSGELDCKTLVNVFMHPDADTPDGLADALYFIHEMATTDGMDQLMEEAEKSAIRIAYHPGSTPEDIAIQVWLADREIVERKHAEQFLTRPKSFEYYQSEDEPTSIAKLKNDTLRGIEKNLDDWFEKKKRGRTSRVFAYPRGAETWFLVRHGEPYKREGSIKDGESSSVFYRPETFDVVVYNETIGEIRVSASTLGEKKLYRQTFGRHFFGDANFFPGTGKYTLDPLKSDGEAALVCSDVEGLEWVLLKELHFYWGGQFREVEIRKADDVLASFSRNGHNIHENARLIRAKFQVKFENAKNPRTLIIRPPNVANFTRDGDSVIGEVWLTRRGFVLNVPTEENENTPQ
jgi:hypothetical protein